MEFNMTSQALFHPHFPVLRGFSASVLLRLDAAYRSYRAFRDLPVERLTDVGLTRQDQAGARFMSFYSRAMQADGKVL